MKKLALALALASCTPAQTAGTVGAVTSPECIACASQIIQGVTAEKRALVCAPPPAPSK